MIDGASGSGKIEEISSVVPNSGGITTPSTTVTCAASGYGKLPPAKTGVAPFTTRLVTSSNETTF